MQLEDFSKSLSKEEKRNIEVLIATPDNLFEIFSPSQSKRFATLLSHKVAPTCMGIIHAGNIEEHHKRYLKDSDWNVLLIALEELYPQYASR